MLNLNNIFNKYNDKLEINNYYTTKFIAPPTNLYFLKINKVILQFKGIYYCNVPESAYYFVCQVIDFITYCNSDEITECKDQKLTFRLLHTDNINLVNSNINENRNSEVNRLNSPYFVHETDTLENWVSRKPYVAFKKIVHGTEYGFYSELQSCDTNKLGKSSIYDNFHLLNTEIEIHHPLNTYKRKMTIEDVYNSQPIHNQCHSYDNVKYYFVEYSPKKMYETICRLPLLVNPSILENGCYTYMLLSTSKKDMDLDLYLMKTNTIFELGTKHPEIIKRAFLQNSLEYCKVYLGWEVFHF